ncbi:acyl carrier protein [Chloroflexi bacterium TSY]|nr:acyl carrier protein [Chloroflexi bacterium TSY]
MTRNEIFDVVKSYMVEIIDDLDETSKINETDRMADLGADSIDVVEVVSDSMRALRVKVDRTKLDSAQNLAGLLNLLEEAVSLKNGDLSTISKSVDAMSEAELDTLLQGQ